MIGIFFSPYARANLVLTGKREASVLFSACWRRNFKVIESPQVLFMDLSRKLGMFLGVSAITALFFTFMLSVLLKISLVEGFFYFVFSFLVVLGLLFVAVALERELLSTNPFRGLIAISAGSFALALAAMLGSLQNAAAFFSFASCAVLFLSMVMRSHSLRQAYEKLGRREFKIKELPLVDRIWIMLFFCGFLLFLLLAWYFLGWVPSGG